MPVKASTARRLAASAAALALCCGRTARENPRNPEETYRGLTAVVLYRPTGPQEEIRPVLVCANVSALWPAGTIEAAGPIVVLLTPADKSVEKGFDGIEAGAGIKVDVKADWDRGASVQVVAVSKLEEKDKPKLDCK